MLPNVRSLVSPGSKPQEDSSRAALELVASRSGSAGDLLVASRDVAPTLSQLSGDARARSGSREAQAAFQRWRDGSPTGRIEEETIEVFASEAGFAAAARCLLEIETGRRGEELSGAFPHLYGSPLFSWYEPEPGLVCEVVEAIREHKHGDDPVAFLGWLYQFSIPDKIRSRFGQFYTGQVIVNGMLDGVGYVGSEPLGRRLIDPACGAGAFLIEATRRLIAAAEREELSGDETYGAVRNLIHGLDLNPLGILLTEAAIALLVAPYLPADASKLAPLHLYITDTLRRGDLLGETHAAEAERIKTCAGEYEVGFDFVVANPPYGKYPTRLFTRQQAARFAETTYGHPNLYGLFLQIGVELLSPGGRLAFINPKSFVSGLYFRNLRRFLAQHLDLERFDSFEKRSGLFDGVLQEVVILYGTRSSGQSETIELHEYSGAPTGQPASSIEAPSSSVLLGKDLDCVFFTSADPAAHEALVAMLARGKPLRELGFRASTGTIVWNRLKDHVRDEPSRKALPLIWGNAIREYRFAGLGNRAGSSSHVELTHKTQMIVSSGEALLVKRMTAPEERRRLVACRVPRELTESDQGYFAENHVNLVRKVGSNRNVDLDAILGLLNSELFDHVFRALSGNTQVSATELEMLPIADGPELGAIAELARRLTAVGGAEEEARRELDELVYRLYGIGEEVVAAIRGSYAVEAVAA